MKKISKIKMLLAMLFLLLPQQHFAQEVLDYSTTRSISEDIVRTIDSAFSYKKYRNKSEQFKGVRILDTKNKFFLTDGWAYFTDKTRFVVIQTFPYDLNTKDYIDFIVVDVKEEHNTICIETITILNESCDEIPVYMLNKYRILDHDIEKVKSIVRVLDDWDPMAK